VSFILDFVFLPGAAMLPCCQRRSIALQTLARCVELLSTVHMNESSTSA
jgi:hypothetical protein